jgi:CBS domain-containing protein
MAISSPDVMTETIDEIMSREVITFKRHSKLSDICECLLKHGFHQVPVVDQNTLVGIISRLDILRMKVRASKS